MSEDDNVKSLVLLWLVAACLGFVLGFATVTMLRGVLWDTPTCAAFSAPMNGNFDPPPDWVCRKRP